MQQKSMSHNNSAHPHSHPTNLLEQNLSLRKRIDQLVLQQQKLRLTLSDYEFEIKRLNEDMATFKTLSELDKVKNIKEYESKIAQLRKQVEEDNQNWIKRFEIRDKELKAELHSYLEKQKQENQVSQAQKKKHLSEVEQSLKHDKEQAIAIAERKAKQEIAKAKQEAEKHVAQSKSQCEKRVKSVESRATELLDKTRRDHQLQVVMMRSEKQSEENMHSHTKKELQQLKQRLYEEIYTLNKQRQDLQDQLTVVHKKNKELEAALATKTQAMDWAAETHAEQLKIIKNQVQEEISMIKQTSQTQMVAFIQRHLAKTNELDNTMRVLETKQNQQADQYATQVQQLKTCYNQRPSRGEDLQMIQQLQEKLWKKENDLELVVQELKWHRLELENKEETYNKIFTNGYNINEFKFPIQKLRTLHKEFKFRKMARSLLKDKEARSNSSNRVQPQRIL